MGRIVMLLIIVTGGIGQAHAQKTSNSNFDTFVSMAVELAEKELYNSQFDNALKYVDILRFKEFKEFDDKHEVIIAVNNLRVQSFKARLYQEPFSTIEKLEELRRIQSKVWKIEDENIKAKYYATLSSFYRSHNIDSCVFYENEALAIYKKLGNNEALSELRATRISRELDNYFSEDKKESALKLIPEFKKEIEYSEKHSDYATAYNTRHLANIYRIYNVDINEALRLYKRSLDLRKKIGFTPFIAASHYSVGLVYAELKMFDLAIEEYIKSLEAAERVHFIRYEVRPLVRIGEIYYGLGENVKAKGYYTKAIKVAARYNYSEEGGVDGILEKLDLLK